MLDVVKFFGAGLSFLSRFSPSWHIYPLDRLECRIWAIGCGYWLRLGCLEKVKVLRAGALGGHS